MAIYVTKSFMPPKKEYIRYVNKIYETYILTNCGPLTNEFESKMRKFLSVENFHYVTNGTIALQLALAALDINDGEIITTPFSYVATSSSILWQRCKPVFVDIEPNSFTIDANKIESAITKKTRAIMPVHVFGYAADVDKIQKIANEHDLKVIYDGAHAFGAKYKGKSLLSYGDISTCSFHATKLFHTIEGGACIAKDKNVSDKIELIRRFGHTDDNHYMLGINGKQSEFHAAMGLASLPYINKIIVKRKHLSDLYDKELAGYVKRPKQQADLEYNYAYYPVIFKSEDELFSVFNALADQDIYPRRYFYPSLNTIVYMKGSICPISEDISRRIACLPLSYYLSSKDTLRICQIIKGVCRCNQR